MDIWGQGCLAALCRGARRGSRSTGPTAGTGGPTASGYAEPIATARCANLTEGLDLQGPVGVRLSEVRRTRGPVAASLAERMDAMDRGPCRDRPSSVSRTPARGRSGRQRRPAAAPDVTREQPAGDQSKGRDDLLVHPLQVFDICPGWRSTSPPRPHPRTLRPGRRGSCAIRPSCSGVAAGCVSGPPPSRRAAMGSARSM